MDLFIWQITFVIAIFMAVIVCCLVPVILFRRAYSRDVNYFWTKMLNWCDCLTGGVFLAMCFLGLLPNVQEQAALVLQGLHLASDFPVAECAILLGFFVVLTFDQMSKRCDASRVKTRRIMEMSSLDMTGGGDDDGGSMLEDRHTLLPNDDVMISNGIHGGGALRASGDDDEYDIRAPSTSSGIRIPASIASHRQGESSSSRTQLFGEPNGGRRHHSHSHGHVLALVSRSASGFRFLVLLFALSTHALFEGIVLGLQRDIPKAIHLFMAIILHEAVVAATLGFHIAKAKHTVWTAVRYSLLFSACIPIGIGLGMGIGQTPGTLGHIISGSLQAVAAGIFLHITFMQLLPHEFEHGNDGLVKTLFLFIGFLLLTTLNLAMDFSH